MKIIQLEQIKQKLPQLELIPEIEAGFVAYSQGKAVIPPVGELLFDDPPGDVHIKYGYIRGEEYYVIKIASGFYQNPALDLPSSNGMMLLFSQKTGEPQCILLDQGHLTDVRTAVAGAIAAKYLAPENVQRIGIVGCGIQGRLQLLYLKSVVNCREAMVWSRHAQKLEAYKQEMDAQGFHVLPTQDVKELAQNCNLIVTATPSREPLLFADWIQPGTHITAVGSDTPEKQELDAAILAKADLVVADSISQCRERGEIHHAIDQGILHEEDLVELGAIIAGSVEGRSNDEQITVADLTGVAVQDLQIAKCFADL